MYKIRLQWLFFKLATNDPSDKMFLLSSKICPQGVVSPCLGAIYMYKIMKKKCIKSDFKEIFFKLVANDRSDNRYLLISKFYSLGLSASDFQLYIFIKSWKDVYKVRDWRDCFLKMQQDSDKAFLLISKFGPNGSSAPTLGLCFNFFSSITADFNISSALRWAIQDQWSSGIFILPEYGQRQSCRVRPLQISHGSSSIVGIILLLGLDEQILFHLEENNWKNSRECNKELKNTCSRASRCK